MRAGLSSAVSRTAIAYVLQDGSAHGLSPRQWAEKAAALYEVWSADLIVVEVNQGGDMVKEMLAQVDDTLPVKGVVARRAKGRRAEPVAMLYEQGRVKHVGGFKKLEDEMNRMSREGLMGKNSPDRRRCIGVGDHQIAAASSCEADHEIRV